MTVEVIQDLRQIERDYDAQRHPATHGFPYRNNPYENWRYRIYRLQRELPGWWIGHRAYRPITKLKPAVVDLAAITLSWMFTTLNRFVRDRATKALVALLTSRLESATRLVERFADVNDPYVTERVYAVAYGVAMRGHDSLGVGNLASAVYRNVFASGSPPPHVLLRDYARGVIERAIRKVCAITTGENSP